MDWIKKQKLPAIEAIQFNGHLYIELDDLWQACYLSFNSTQNYCISLEVLQEIANKLVKKWSSFLEEEFTSAIAKCNNSSTPGPDKLS